MKKSERLNDMMLFLNDKNVFQLSDIMTKYDISRSTAIRDVKSLEEIGMPIYSERGRNGHYQVLRNRLLSPIVFNIDEVFALYFSMLTLKAYETTPFHLSVEKLKTKFERCLSAEKIEMLRKTEEVFSLGYIKHNNQCEFLDVILQFTMEEKVCQINYDKKGIEKTYVVQFYNISSAYGQWYVTSYNFETKRMQVFRCDRILELEENHAFEAKKLTDLKSETDYLYKKKDAINFEVEIASNGVDLFFKENYPSMKLNQEQGRNVIRGFYNRGEEPFIINYLLGFGDKINMVQPDSLKEMLLNELKSLQNHLQKLS
ncbi:YafY family transcriptional regulator [Listeria monocytogenes]|mgnify:CR=1 FL=1|uniref:Lmo0364 protein n=11 Tax=Listeria monocytogenes TaxID=1639 RepID=Q8YA03_LISMO|nr:YafY family protein [Listeria monocytogenes]NP_463894.1 transcriptional regulator [Listeria monocytogenes EGD-e]EAD5037565.1 YafY family transcriptional regulator [Listeria monocytogenes serotype 1/2a]EAE3702197.1 YafY family transcriptional regulator [Listeria monocytogenes serotype 1/2c]EAE6022785.1 YafY family transcriptional regulator [Listeria monocytogenes serotype 3a]EAF4501966.1 YafY family transcriptional regulator [Listeria monocytogenes serotype 4b]EAG6270849.1 YafY family trans